VRAGSVHAQARRQESLAVSTDGDAWFLLNASPEIRAQVESFSALWPRAPRHSPVAGIVLTNGDLDHCLGLLSLRESHPLFVYATREVERGFTEGNVLYRTLQRFPGQVTWNAIELGREQLLDAHGAPGANIRMTAFAAPGKRPVHLENVGTPGPEDNIGVLLRATDAAEEPPRAGVASRTGTVVAYVPAVSHWTESLQGQLELADVVFLDGTFWSSAEMSSSGVGTKRAEDMAHLPIGGAQGSLERLRRLPARRKILIHINNTNPILRDDSPERAQVIAAGVEIATDDLELTV